MSRNAELDCKVYVGDLPNDASEKELEQLFGEYGRLRKVWVARNPPGFAFVEFEDPRDADDAIRGLDGHSKFGRRIRVEPSTGKSKPKPWQRDGGRGRGPPRYDSYRSDRDRGPRGRPFDPRDKCYKCGESGHYAYDCREDGGGQGGPRGGRGRSRSRSPRDDYRGGGGDRRRRPSSRSRSRSRSMDRMPRRSRSGSRN